MPKPAIPAPVAKGLVPAADFPPVIGALLTIGSAVLSVADKPRRRKECTTAGQVSANIASPPQNLGRTWLRKVTLATPAKFHVSVPRKNRIVDRSFTL